MDDTYRLGMLKRLGSRPISFPELSYANENQPPLKRWFMGEARGESGDVPKLLQGETV